MTVRKDSPNRKCSECGESLAGKSAKAQTCSQNCRGKRSRRIKRQNANRERNKVAAVRRSPGVQALYELVDDEIEDVTKAVIQDELRPIVREAITEDAIRAIQGLIALTPDAIRAIGEDINGTTDDEGEVHLNFDRRQKAYTMLMRYTVGHGAIVQQQDPSPPAINVVFPSMERPAQSAPPIQSDDPPPEVELVDETVQQLCQTCGETKDEDAFVGKSPRCKECHEKLQAQARRLEQGITEKPHG